MPFSRERLEEVRSGIDRALTSGVLNDWERTFLADMRDRLERYGTRTALSDKQYKLLMKLSGAERTAGKVVPLSSAREPTSAPPRRQGIRRSQIGWTYLRRAMRRAIRRFVVLVIAVVVLFAVVTLIDRRQPFLPESFGPPSSTESRYSKSVKARQIRVIDGDTVKVQGESRNVRLVGYNAPEVFSPECSREEALGNQATARLQALLQSAGSIEFERVACSCPPGTEGTSECNFGRICGALRVDGLDVGGILVSEGLAVRYFCGRTSCLPKPGNWCN